MMIKIRVSLNLTIPFVPLDKLMALQLRDFDDLRAHAGFDT